MAITKLTRSTSIYNSAKYLEGKPHHPDYKYIWQRNLAMRGVNAPSNVDDFIKQSQATLKRSNMKPGGVQVIRKIISFDPKQISYKSPTDRSRALNMAVKITREQFPHNQSLVALQADSANHVVHAHCLTCARQFTDGKSITHRATWKRSVPYTDKVVFGNGYDINTKPHQSKAITNEAVRHIEADGHYSFLTDLRNRITLSAQYSQTPKQFIDKLKKNGVYPRSVMKLRKNKKTQQYQFHFYSHPTKRGIYDKVTHHEIKFLSKVDPQIAKNSHIKQHLNEYVRAKKHATYKFYSPNGHVYIVRDKKLGSDCTPQGLKALIQSPVPQRTLTHATTVNYTKNTKNGSERQNRANKVKVPLPKITVNDLHATVKQKSYIFKNHGWNGGDSRVMPNPMHISREPLQHPIMQFHPKNPRINAALGKLTSALSMPTGNHQKNIARQAAIAKARSNFDDKAAQIVTDNQQSKAFVHQQNRENAEQVKEQQEEIASAQRYQMEEYYRNQGPSW